MAFMKKIVARELLEIGAVSLETKEEALFQWVSGIRSPIYCDNRLIMGYPRTRNIVAQGLARLIETRCGDVEAIVGTATAGIPHAAFVANAMNLPMAYVRGEAKQHGKGRQIEGPLAPMQKVVLIEDLLSTGGSSIKACEALKQAGMEVLGVVAIFSYAFPELDNRFAEAEIPFWTLTDYPALLNEALEMGIISEAAEKTLKAWREDPWMFVPKE